MSPYENLPSSAYWRTGVAQSAPETTEDVYSKKFEITKTMRIATAGSCFAQHIARHMRARGFNVLDVEPAPQGLKLETAQKFGYNIYSARYANIYVVRQLLQLFDEAFGTEVPQDEPWEKNGRFYDPFRPSVEPLGLSSPEEVKAHRAAHLSAVQKLFRQADLFIFTLGLTEGWMNKETGVVYPTAPGTIAGTFDPDKYVFKNFTYPEIIRDLRQFRVRMKKLNPRVKFLFTVSPVPLTATASGKHVLPATVYSKSVLRAVAQDVADQFPDVDYFPSYDLIASHWSGGRFFNPNLRTVRDEGVGSAMRAFFLQHDPDGAPVKEAPAGAEPKVTLTAEEEAEDLVCEDLLLEAFSK